MNASEHDPVGAVTAFLQALPARVHAPCAGEWGVLLEDVGGRPLEVGVRVSGGLVRAQAWVAPAGVVDPHLLLHRNRLATLARYAHSAAGEVHIHAEIPAHGVRAEELDRMMVSLVEAASAVRA
jgi:hypothetical protein